MNIPVILQKIRNRSYSRYYAYKDFKTTRKILIFESDDWGSIRVPSVDTYNKLIELGYNLNLRPYERFDTLETDSDIQELYNVLLNYKDFKGNHPIITANVLVANPDFDIIKKNGYRKYVYESVLDTYKNSINSQNVFSLMQEGLNMNIFRPQSHGREHFNVDLWLSRLQNYDEDVRTAFEYKMCGLFPKSNPSIGNKCMIAFNSTNSNKTISEGLDLFYKIWGFKSISFIAPCYTWSINNEQILNLNGVKLIQSGRSQRIPNSNKLIFHYTGEYNSLGQYYTVRNCTFEPSTITKDRDVDNCFRQIERCFNNNNIAIISTHRINYVSGIKKENRDKNLILLESLLKKILYKFPNVEFMSSDQLIKVLK